MVQRRRVHRRTHPESAGGATCRCGTASGQGVAHWVPRRGLWGVDEAFRQGLRDLGYIEGQNITIEYRHADNQLERLADLAAELVRLPVDVLVTPGENAARVAQQATHTIPIVLAAGSDPVGLGLVASLARPGGNLTGLSLMGSELEGKRLELLKEAVPTVSRVGVLFNPASIGAVHQWRETERAARSLGVQLHPLEVRSADELEGAFAAATIDLKKKIF